MPYKEIILKSHGGFYRKKKVVQLCAKERTQELLKGISAIGIKSTLFCNIDKNLSKKLQNEPYLEAMLLKSNAFDILQGKLTWNEWLLQDFDKDGLSNQEELEMGLNFVRKDSDFDELSDYEELFHYNTNPKNPDSDKDFLPDYYEIAKGYDPLNKDSNNNGILDGLEGDNFFRYQWYIKNDKAQNICTTSNEKTIKGIDLGVLGLYHYTLGKNQIVQVVDSGVDSNHSDLTIDLNNSFNVITHSNNPSPATVPPTNPANLFYWGHGTCVAGIIGAKGFNNYGIRGIGPNLKIAGNNFLQKQDLNSLAKVWLQKGNFRVSNNSWGAKFLNETSYEELIKEATINLNHIFVFAAGNDRKSHGNANLSYLLNNPFVIAVAALNHKAKVASYSNPGSDIFISAFGGEHYYSGPTIFTTFASHKAMYKSELHTQKGPITIEQDINKDFTFAANGTSAAAPMVSAEIALILSVCKNLSWRDVKWLIAHTAKRIDLQNSSWIKNGAGLYFSNDYGFGLINGLGVVKECIKPTFTNLPPLVKIQTPKKFLNKFIPDRGTIKAFITIDQDILIEWIGLVVDINHPNAGDINIDLISPSHTKSNLIKPNYLQSNAYKGGFRFSSNAFLGEHSKGIWQVEISDKLQGDYGQINSLYLIIWGHKNE